MGKHLAFNCVSGYVTYSKGHQRSLKFTFFLKFTLLLVYEHVNTHIMYSQLISIDKLCVTFEGHLETSKGHFEVT